MKLLLIDTSALFHRSRSALLRAMGEMTTSYGIPVTGTYGFCSALFSLIEKNSYDCVVPCVDMGGNFRKEGNSDYKANREKASIAHYADLGLLLEEVLPALGFNPVGMKGYEADDVIAHISRTASPCYSEIHIFTCDKDLLQLISNRVKVVLFNSSKKVDLVGLDEVQSHFGVPPEEIKFFKALNGDSSDNIEGLKGIGPKTAVSIINSCKLNKDSWLSLADRIVLHPKVKEHASKFLENLRLVDLSNDVPNLEWYASSPPFQKAVEAVFTSLEFKSFLKEKRLGKILKTLKVDENENSLGSAT
jgi:DNA polymerase-1